MRLSLFLAVCILLSASLMGQTQKIASKQKELDNLRSEISKLEKDLRSTKTKEKRTKDLLETYNRQIHLITRLVNTLQEEVEQRQLLIENTQNQIKALEYQTNFLKSSYSAFMTHRYQAMFQVNHRVFVDSLATYKKGLMRTYSRSFSENAARELARIDSTRIQTIALQKELNQDRIEKENLISQKTKEELYLQQQQKNKQQLLERVRKDQSSITADIDAKKKAEQKIQSLIVQLIEKARQKAIASQKQKTTSKKSTEIAEAPHERAAETGTPLTTYYKGKLLSPIQHGSVIRHFGQSRNEKLNTVTVNYGIDIKASGELPVRAAADGTVSVINWIPGYGTVIIVTHANDLRTVYGRVTNVSVREGQTIKSGSSLGQINEGLDGFLLHFEVWNGRQSQNPELWIGRF
ncbi:MAG: peptidoglycan DD-metalloendopeptidase family protein [Ignavibacteria bacterium]|nr:peptidoglycan DD-metalloendopeptidase family protein [Ignavibacteria bacterium]